MATYYFNGKFTAQAIAGVQRASQCMLAALDRQLAEDKARRSHRWVLLCPPGLALPALRHIEVRVVGSALAGLNMWEQCFLPRAARDGLLVSLGNAAPAFATRQICTFHDAAVFDRPDAYTWVFILWYRWLFRRLARRAVAIDTVSQFSKGRLVVHLGLSASQVKIIPLGGDHLDGVTADPMFLAARGLAGRRFVLAVGSHNPNKNLVAVIEAFSLLDEEGLLLVVVGGSHGAVFAGAASGDSRDARIVRLGYVSDAELKALYGAAAALVFVSLYEGFGLPPLEAMSCGCPVLASSAGALPEVCGDGALYADPGSPADIARGLKRLFGDADLRAQFLKRGRVRVAALTWDGAARELRNHLEAHAAGTLPTRA